MPSKRVGVGKRTKNGGAKKGKVEQTGAQTMLTITSQTVNTRKAYHGWKQGREEGGVRKEFKPIGWIMAIRHQKMPC